jgi:hypothetical protein
MQGANRRRILDSQNSYNFMLLRSPDGAETEPRPKRVVVVFEDSGTREHALRSNPELAEAGSHAEVMMVQWCSFGELADTAALAEAALGAAAADLVVFAISPSGELPGKVKTWIEHWVTKRGDREGALIGLVARTNYPREIACLKEIYLRHTAHRAGMDYLSQFPPAMAKAIPESLDSYQNRAHQVTAVLDEILHSHPPLPPARL